jgi:N-ethylmaleimide reductase
MPFLEILATLSQDWGPGRIGLKISPTLAMGGFKPTEQTICDV